ncbi:MAG: double-strand break repair protein AddB [Pseudomonadota bacterium]
MSIVPGDPSNAIFGVPPGADFVACLTEHLDSLQDSMAPESAARIQVLVPTRRMQRRLKSVMEGYGNLILPKIGLVSDVTHLLHTPVSPKPVSQLRRVLDLKQVVAKLAELDPRLSRSDVIDLTFSLTKLLDEMEGECVAFEALEQLETGDQSGHWEQSLTFLRTIRAYVEALADQPSGTEAQHRLNVTALCNEWSDAPLKTPVILAGSTGSRATTRLLMEAVAKLPNGQIVLPGFDFEMPNELWDRLTTSDAGEDHPQYRFATFLHSLSVTPSNVKRIGQAPDPARTKLVSIALRPAPITDQWLRDGPLLGDLQAITSGLSLIEAREPKEEALAIATAMRVTMNDGETVALVTPDATLARRVTAELKRWRISPDESGGVPLSLTPTGRFLRQTAIVAGGTCDPVSIIALLKHPFTFAGENRGAYMRQVQEFELFLRKTGSIKVDERCLRQFAAQSADAGDWIDWLKDALAQTEMPRKESLQDAFDRHTAVYTAFAGASADHLFNGDAGEKVLALLQLFREATTEPSTLPFGEYVQLLERFLMSDSARMQLGVFSNVMIWGTLEARAQGANTVILAGLNEGVWPEQPVADSWLNRDMRRQVGLLLPERQIGLAAHDFQQAIGAQTVILSRSMRTDGSETVPSRWLSRLTNLLTGLKENNGPAALEGMSGRGHQFLSYARNLDRPAKGPTPATRPAPAPPVHMRPRDFAVTEIKRLIQDPYAVYARRVLRLRPLDPLVPEMNARLKGIVFHEVLEHLFHPSAVFEDLPSTRKRLVDIASRALADRVPDATTRAVWLGQLKNNAEWFHREEVKRRDIANPLATEAKGTYSVPDTEFALRGTADRIDRFPDGGLVIYDYKSGTPPTRIEITRFDRQLLLEAVMAESGAFEAVPAATVAYVSHIGVGRSPSERITMLTGEDETVTIAGQIARLLRSFLKEDHGFMSRRAMETSRFSGDYDHLARFGEWDPSNAACIQRVGQ